MADCKKEIIDLSGTITYSPEELKEELRNVRALIVEMLPANPDINVRNVASALALIQYLAEDVDYKPQNK
ncbi:MAG: hypothetical protein IKS24_07355 [Bacteroidaceae bacterium]|jgi:hypothetical protein|nr:hypothetical protein [Bacteroidaceae bacterium]